MSFLRAKIRGKLRQRTPLKIKPAQIQLRQLLRQEVQVPGAFVGLVVHQAQGVHLLRGQIIHADARYLLQPHPLGRQEPAMPDDQHTLRIHHQRLRPSKLADAFGHIGDLRRVMPFRIGGVGCYGIQPPHFDFHKALLPVPDLGTVTLQLCGTGQNAPA